MRRYTVAFLFVASLFLTACVHTARICKFTPVYKTTFDYKATINDIEVPVIGDVFQDDNVKIRIFYDSTQANVLFDITNLKGGLMSYNTLESSLSSDFVESYPGKSPWIPKNESFIFSIQLPQKKESNTQTLVLLDKSYYYDKEEYEKFRSKFYSKIEEIEKKEPSSYDEKSYFSFVVHFYNGDYYFYKVTYTYAVIGIKYDSKIYEKEYRDASEFDAFSYLEPVLDLSPEAYSAYFCEQKFISDGKYYLKVYKENSSAIRTVRVSTESYNRTKEGQRILKIDIEPYIK